MPDEGKNEDREEEREKKKEGEEEEGGGGGGGEFVWNCKSSSPGIEDVRTVSASGLG